MSREEIFFDAITNIREGLVDEAQEYHFRRHRASWRQYAKMAACLALAATLFFGTYTLAHIRMGGMVGTDSGPSSNTSGAPDANGSPPPEDAPPNYGMAGDSTSSLNAVVREVHDTYLLVEQIPSETDGWIEVSLDGLENVPELQEGDIVVISCESITWEYGKASAAGVTEIRLADSSSASP